MREIKFRAWDKLNKRMVEVYGLKWVAGRLWDISTNHPDAPMLHLYGPGEQVELRQFTGLKDKNGREIYEGDILEDERGLLRIVQWNNGGYWEAAHRVTPFTGPLYEIDGVKIKVEVIGNIYQNPDLLKVAA